LLDGDGGRDAGEAVDGGAGHLLDELARVGRHRLHEAALALGEYDVEGEGALAGAGYAGDDGQLAVGDSERDVFEVVFAGAGQNELVGVQRGGRSGAIRRGGFGGEFGPLAGARGYVGEGGAEEGGRGGGGAGDEFGRAFGDDLAAVGAGFGADLDEPVGGLEDVEVVLDDDDAVAAINEGLEDRDQAFDVVAVEAGGGFVEEDEGSCGNLRTET
jgi:hypothetical protein